MRRIQIHIDEELDALATEAARQGVSKAAYDDEPGSVDEVVYGRR